MDAKQSLELSSLVTIGQRTLGIVSEIFSFWSDKGSLAAIITTPIALIIFEGTRRFALSLKEGSDVTLEELILREPSLREKLLQNQPS